MRFFVRSLAVSAVLQPALAQQQGQVQKIPPPKWLSDDGKDIFNDVESDDVYYSDLACESREKLLKLMAGHGEKDAADYRVRVLMGLGLCELKAGNWEKSKKRWDSAVGEMNAPNDDYLLKNPQSAPIALTKQAVTYLAKHEVTQAATQFRRAREIIDRNLKNVLKQLLKQMAGGAEAPPLEMLTSEISGYGKTGMYMPNIVKQYPMFKQELQWAEILENTLTNLDKKLASFDPAQKDKRIKLDVSSKSKEGSLLYVRLLAAAAKTPGEHLLAAQELKTNGAVKALKKEADSLEKSVTLIKRSKDGTGCKEPMKATCEAVKKVADLQSNAFGETRVVLVKAGKTQQLDSCTTNANIGILVAAKDGATVRVGKSDATPLQAGEPLVIDFCQASELVAGDENVAVLFGQAWHPEFAAVERTTELRARAKAFSLDEDEVKAAAKVVNDYAKKSWDKASKQWREGSSVAKMVKEGLLAEGEAKKQEAEAAAEAKRKDELENDDERKENLKKLEEKRAAKRLKEEEAENKRIARKKELEAARASRDPWLNDPAVLEVEQNLNDMKQARRDANAKLEFDLSTQLTKDISKAEQDLKKVTKKAKKAYKKGATTGSAGKAEKEEKKEDKQEDKVDQKADKAGGEKAEEESLKKRLAEVKAQKAKAAEADDFEGAKKLKKEQETLEGKLKKLSKKSDGGEEAESLRKRLAEVKAQKAQASEDEDFGKAKKLKKEQKDIEEKLQKLEL